MRALLRSGPLLLALGVLWTGCSQSGDAPPKPGAQASARRTDLAKSEGQDKTRKANGDKAEPPVIIPAGSECVLTVEGMA